jgi:cysteine synthase
VKLRQIVRRRGLEGRILAKLEYLNPGSSKKDRVALEIVRRARADGQCLSVLHFGWARVS